MNPNEEIVEIIKYAEAGKRLNESADYDLLVRELESELASTWRELSETPTTDPVMAKLQGKLRTLESVLGRAHLWVQRRLDYIQSTKPETVTTDGDYDTG